MKAKVGEINLGVAGGNQSVTGLGFQPKIVFFWGNRSTATGATYGTASGFFGAAVSSTSRRVAAFAHGTAGDSWAMQDTTKCGFVPRNSPSSTPKHDWLIDLVSMDADGFTIGKTFRAGGTTNVKVSYLALGGDDLTNVFVGQFTEPGSSGDQAITGVGFQPTLVVPFSAMIANTATANLQDIGGHMVGIGNLSDEAVVAGAQDDLVNPVVAKSYSRVGDFIALINSSVSSIDARATLKTLDSDGFTNNWGLRASTREIFFAALKFGGASKIGSLATRTDGNNIAVTGVGGKPEAILFGSHNKGFSTAGTLDADHKVSIGAASGVTDRGANASYMKDAFTVGVDSDQGYGHDPAEVYVNLTGINTCTIDALMDMVSLDVDGFTAVMDDVESVVADVWFAAIYTPPIKPTGIASAEAFGTPTMAGAQTIGPSGVPSAEVVDGGNTAIAVGKIVLADMPISEEALGTPKVNLTVYPVGVASAQAFGFPGQNHDPQAPGIFHAPRQIVVSGAGPSSGEVFGHPIMRNGFWIVPVGIFSGEGFGDLGTGIRPTGIFEGDVPAPIVRRESVVESGKLIRSTEGPITVEIL